MHSRLRILGYLLVFSGSLGLSLRATAAQESAAQQAADRAAQQAADRARTKVVVLKTARVNGRGSASGFLVGPGVVVTAAHTVVGVDSITAWMNGVSYRARVSARHPEHDLAVLTLDAPELLLKPLEVAPTSTSLVQGEALLVLAAGSQSGAAKGDPSDRVPIAATFDQRVNLRNPDGKVGLMLSLNASVQRGDSGSPIIRVRDGKVIGLLSSRELPDVQGVSRIAYAVPAELIRPWLEAAVKRTPVVDEDFYLLKQVRKPAPAPAQP